MDRLHFGVLFGLCLVMLTLEARPLTAADVPKPLEPWVGWVLKGHEERTCPFLYNSFEHHRCAWPTQLELELNQSKGTFVQRWQVYAESWVKLPGDQNHWPQDITLNGNPVLVLEREGRPALSLVPGKHALRGHFLWERLPESIAIPQDTGIVALKLNGKSVAYPFIEDGALWLREREAGRKAREGAGDRLELQVFRRVIDEVPLELITRVEIDVAGDPREVLLGTVLLPGLIPLRLESPLPSRLEPDGRLRLQLRPGHWSVEFTARAPKVITELPLFPSPAPWVDTEVWVFDARNHLRLVEVEGVPTVDPHQTNLPQEWQQLPAYRLKPGDSLMLKVIRRGDPDPEPDKLSLQRDLWLDFNGQGYTVKDTITGSMTRGWRLETHPEILLGRVDVAGQLQFITRLPGSDKRGVEVRRGALNLTADSRYEGRKGSIPAAGWGSHDFQRVQATLHLPPGWRLFAATGIDNVPASWLQRWTLLDLFVVLIAALAAGHLWGWPLGLLVLVSLTLLWHEASAPRYVWLHLLVAIALLRVLPPGRFYALVSAYRNIALIVLLFIAILFAVDQVRIGLYPQLERPGEVMPAQIGSRLQPPAPSAPGAVPEEAITPEALERDRAAESYELREKVYPRAMRKAEEKEQQILLDQLVDPKALIQTGPGLPGWRWTDVSLVWNGPVERDQRLGLLLLSPAVNLALNLLRVLGLVLMVLLMFGISYTWRKGGRRLGTGTSVVGLLLVVPLLASIPGTAQAADFPSPKLLEELKTRLLEPPECLPSCAQIPRMRLEIGPETLQARIEIDAIEAVAVPLPAQISHWLPATVLVDGAAAEGLFRTPEGGLWLDLSPGRRQIILAGPLPHTQSLQLPLLLRPHRVEVQANGWRVEGIHENGVVDAQLQFSRITSETGKQPLELEPTVLPPFVRVERTLHLGLDWRVETRIRRLSPAESAVVIEVPLLAGESVTTADIRVVNSKVLVNMPPGEEVTFLWESVLEKRPEIELTAPDTTAWIELWQVDVSPIWHLVPAGIPVVHHQDPQGRWLPTWRPWPGEQLTLAITRPEGVAGPTLTVDRTHLQISPGQRATDTSLDLTLRSSQGGQHTLTLPEDARLQAVTINGAAQPIRQEGQSVTLPIQPGQQSMTLILRQPKGIRLLFSSPLVNLAIPSVNSTINIKLGNDRWVLLTGGPQLGPAVLFWGVLVVIVIIALGLGRIRLTPLTTSQWLLLGIGLSQTPVWGGLIVVGWLLALGGRARLKPEISTSRFNMIQLGLIVLTLMALSFLFDAIEQGLLGLPEMQIAGNNSSAYDLNWYQDRSPPELPRAWILSVPLMVYRLLMLAWALWLAFALLRWLRWGWSCFTTHGMWRSFRLFHDLEGYWEKWVDGGR
jgi:hypothetical protein